MYEGRMNKLILSAILATLLVGCQTTTNANGYLGPQTPLRASQNIMQKVPYQFDYSFYAGSDFENVNIPDNFDYINETKLVNLIETGEYKRWYIQSYYGWDKLWRDGCVKMLKEFNVTTNRHAVTSTIQGTNATDQKNKSFLRLTNCLNALPPNMHADHRKITKSMQEIILYHATNFNVREKYIAKYNVNDTQYSKYMVLAHTAEYYSIFKDLMSYSSEETKTVEAYFDMVFSGSMFHGVSHRTPNNQSTACDVKNPARIATVEWMGRGGCGSYSFNLVTSELHYALATGNDALWTKAKMDLTYLLGTFDNEGIQVWQASRGAMAWGYHSDVTSSLGLLSEIFATVGYDFLQHTMPRSGITVKQVLDMHWKIVDDHTLMGKYSKYNKGTSRKYQNVKDWPTTKLRADEKSIHHIAYNNIRYINEYREDLTPLLKKRVSGNWYHQMMATEYLYYMNNDR